MLCFISLAKPLESEVDNISDLMFSDRGTKDAKGNWSDHQIRDAMTNEIKSNGEKLLPACPTARLPEESESRAKGNSAGLLAFRSPCIEDVQEP